MKQIKNQFILMDNAEFAKWLESQTIKRSIKRIQNHHTWKPRYSGFKDDNHFSLLEGMKRSHLKRDFSDIAQNITTFPDGTIAVCRPLTKIPAGIKGANTGGICIEHVGNFDIGGDEMTTMHKDIIVYLNALLCAKFNLSPDANSIVYHHWWTAAGKRTNGINVAKSCPGTNFFGGNKVEDAEKNFIPKIITQLKKIDASFKEEPVVEKLPISYSKNGVVPYGKELQEYLNQFPGISLKVDGWPGKNSSDALKKVMGHYLVGDPRIN